MITVTTERLRELAVAEPTRHGGTLIDTPLLREITTELADLRDAGDVHLRMLCELLAVIHRDGGHHTARYGTERASADAVHAVLIDRAALHSAQAEVARLRDAGVRLVHITRNALDGLAPNGPPGAARTLDAVTSFCEALEPMPSRLAP